MPAALPGGPAGPLQLLLSYGFPPASLCRGWCQAQLSRVTVELVLPGQGGQRFVSLCQLVEGLPAFPVDPAPAADLCDRQGGFCLVVSHPHEIPSDLDGRFRVLPAPVAGWSAAVAAAGAVAAGVSDPMTVTAGPGSALRAKQQRPRRAEQPPAGFGTDRANQIQMPASSGSTVQLGLCSWPVHPGLLLSGVHGRGRFRTHAAATPPPPEKGERISNLWYEDALLVDHNQWADISDPYAEHLFRHRALELAGGWAPSSRKDAVASMKFPFGKY